MGIRFYSFTSFPFLLLLLSHRREAVEVKNSVEYCYVDDKNPSFNFTSKTNYKNTHGNLSEVNSPADCTLVRMWSFNRHGTRYPSEREIEEFSKLGSTIEKIKENVENGRATLCYKDYELLLKWKWDNSINVSVAQYLTDQGVQDCIGIAERYKQKYPTLLNVPYSKEDFYFRYSTVSRVENSYKAYTYGLFGNASKDVEGDSSFVLTEDLTDCKAWEDEETYGPQEAFRNSSDYTEMQKRVSKHLGFTELIAPDLLETIYSICIFEKAWYVDETPRWCVAFQHEDLKVLEYLDDLDTFYSIGYGDEYSPRVGCPVLQDLYERFNSTVNGTSEGEKVAAFFSHHSELNLFFTAMNLFKDKTPITSENYERQQNRLWRSTIISPFAANIAALLYKCNMDYKVQFLFNERPLNVLDKCSDGICSWEDIQMAFESTAQRCSLDFCDSSAVFIRANYIIFCIIVVLWFVFV